jgi:Zn-dependent protease
MFGFGWAKPVMINPRNFKDPVRDDAIVSLAGPVSNFLIAFLFTGFMKLADMFLPVTVLSQIIFEVLRSTVHINLVLMVFNLLPIPPLDGHHILGSIGGPKVWNFYFKYREHLRFALLLLIIFRKIGRIIGPVINLLYRFLISIFF